MGPRFLGHVRSCGTRQLHASNEPWRGDAQDLEGTSDPTLTSVAREREVVTSNWMSARSEVAFKIAASLIRSRHLIPGIVPALEISPPRIRTGRVNICLREKNFPRARWTRRKVLEGGCALLLKRGFIVSSCFVFTRGVVERGNGLRCVVKLFEHSGTRVADFDTVVKRNVKGTGWRCPTSDVSLVSRRMRRNVDVVTRNRCPSSSPSLEIRYFGLGRKEVGCLEIF